MKLMHVTYICNLHVVVLSKKLNSLSLAIVMSEPSNAVTVGQRVFRGKTGCRHIGTVTVVNIDNSVRVRWANDNHISRDISIASLPAVSITLGATVIRGCTVPAEQITSQRPVFGVVTELIRPGDGNARCSVTWDDRSVTSQSTNDLLDINWIPPIPLNGTPIDVWLKSFAASHNIDISIVTADTYRCSRYNHIDDCKCHNTTGQRTRRLQKSCMCDFRITILKDNTLQFSGTHVHHIPGQLAYLHVCHVTCQCNFDV
jgi:hypothetical protein